MYNVTTSSPAKSKFLKDPSPLNALQKRNISLELNSGTSIPNVEEPKVP